MDTYTVVVASKYIAGIICDATLGIVLGSDVQEVFANIGEVATMGNLQGTRVAMHVVSARYHLVGFRLLHKYSQTSML